MEPTVPGQPTAPVTTPELGDIPPPPGSEIPPPPPIDAIPGITPSPTPDVVVGAIHTDPMAANLGPDIAQPNPQLDSLSGPIAESITLPEDSKAKMTQVFMGLNNALKGAGDNERLQEVILKAAQGVVDDIIKKEGLPEGSAVIDSQSNSAANPGTEPPQP